MQLPVAKFTDSIFDWHITALSAFDRGLARFFMFEIHRRARKTTLAINLLIRETATTPKGNFFYMGPTYAEAKKIVWLDPNMLFSYLPDKRELPWEANQSDLYIHFLKTDSYLHILGGDDPDRLRGIDAEGGVFDEWACMKAEKVLRVIEPIMAQSAVRWLWYLYTPKADTGQHAVAMFDKYAAITHQADLPVNGPSKKRLADWYCMRVIASQSGILPAGELRKLKLRMPAHLYDEEMECARVTAEERALITSKLLDSLEDLYNPPLATRKIISCDPSEGGDEIVIKVFENCAEIDQEIMHKPAIADNLMILSGHVKRKGMEHKCRNYIIDAVGVGRGVADDLRLDENNNVILFRGGDNAAETERFYDINMEATWLTANKMRMGEVATVKDAETRRQLVTASRFQVNHKGQMRLDESKQVKKDLGCSPDRARAFIMGIYGLERVPWESKESDVKYREGRYSEGQRSAMTA